MNRLDPTELDERLKSAVAEVVRRQIEIGIDCVNDGELSKTNFTDYVALPSVPMKMRHGAAGNLDLRARKDDLAHAHAADT